MGTMTAEDRVTVWAEYMAQVSGRRETVALTKDELKEAVDAVDDWLDTADASIYGALPEAAQAALTAGQIRDLFMLVLTKRHERQV